jgi:hypothetical protein
VSQARLIASALLALAGFALHTGLAAEPASAPAVPPPRAASAPAAAAPAARPSALCQALAACIDGAALCVLVQVPAGQRRRVLESEAWADMESRLAALRRQRADLRLVVRTQDLASTLSGVPPAAELRTLWVGAQGLALLSPGLYVDDPTPVDQYFASRRLPDVLQGYAQALAVRRQPGACG